MRFIKIFLCSVVAWSSFSCQKEQESPAVPSSTRPAATAKSTEPSKEKDSTSTPLPENGKEAPSTSDLGQKDAAETANKVATIPPDLKHDAFRYYGFASMKPVKFKLMAAGTPGPQYGEQWFVYDGLKDGKARFTLKRSGDLSQLGTEDIVVDKSGVSVVGTSLGKLSNDRKELPAKLSAGVKWKNVSKLTQENGQSMEHHASYHVIRKEKLKTEAGEYHALLIESQGPATLNGQKHQIVTKTWLVENVGMVKVVMTLTPEKGEARSMTVEATK